MAGVESKSGITIMKSQSWKQGETLLVDESIGFGRQLMVYKKLTHLSSLNKSKVEINYWTLSVALFMVQIKHNEEMKA